MTAASGGRRGGHGDGEATAREREGEDVHSDGEITRKVMPWMARKKRDRNGGEGLGEARPLPERKKTDASIAASPGRFLRRGGRGRRGGAFAPLRFARR